MYLKEKQLIRTTAVSIVFIVTLFNVAQSISDDFYHFNRMWPQPEENWCFRDPKDLSIDSDDNVYVADTGNNRIVKFNSTGKILKSWDSDYPHGIVQTLTGRPASAQLETQYPDVQRWCHCQAPPDRIRSMDRRTLGNYLQFRFHRNTGRQNPVSQIQATSDHGFGNIRGRILPPPGMPGCL